MNAIQLETLAGIERRLNVLSSTAFLLSEYLVYRLPSHLDDDLAAFEIVMQDLAYAIYGQRERLVELIKDLRVIYGY